MKRKLSIVALTLSIFSLLMTTAYAAGGYMLSTEGFERQEKSQWCWAASAFNSAQYETKLHRTQKAAVKHIKGTSADSYPNKPGSISEIKRAAEYISFSRENYYGASISYSFDFLKNQVNLNNVTIACAGYYDNQNVRNGGHAVTITGYYISESNACSLVYFDPWDGVSYTCTYIEFCNGSFNNRRYDGTCYNLES